MQTPPGAARHAARILLVDDDEGNREVLAYFFRRRGFEIVTAGTGEEALAAIEVGTFSLVLLDVVMPGMGGLDVLRELRSRYPASVLPVVMVTGLDASEDVAAATAIGADDYVTKPYQFADVLARIEALLARG
jgi:DNA-binding response OmpR family regulator